MEEQRIVGLGILDEPMHGTQDILLCRLAHGVLLIVCQDYHVLTGIPKVLVQIRAHVLDVIDTSSELSPLAEIVDTNQ